MVRVLVVLPDYNEMNFVHAVLRKVGIDVESLNSTRKFDETALSMNPDVVITVPELKLRGTKKLYESITKRNHRPRIILLDKHYHGHEELPKNVDEICRSPVNAWELVPAICRGIQTDTKGIQDKVEIFFKSDKPKEEKDHVHIKGEKREGSRFVAKGEKSEGEAQIHISKSEASGQGGAQQFKGEDGALSGAQKFSSGPAGAADSKVSFSSGAAEEANKNAIHQSGEKSAQGQTHISSAGSNESSEVVFQNKADSKESAGSAVNIQERAGDAGPNTHISKSNIDTDESQVHIEKSAANSSDGQVHIEKSGRGTGETQVHQGAAEESSSSVKLGSALSAEDRKSKYSQHVESMQNKPSGVGGFVADRAKTFKKASAKVVSEEERKVINENKKSFVNALFKEDSE